MQDLIIVSSVDVSKTHFVETTSTSRKISLCGMALLQTFSGTLASYC